MHWRLTHKGKRDCIENKGGKNLSYYPNQGLQILEDGGYAFKDLNHNGSLDVFEDWRKPLSVRVKDFMQVYHLYQKDDRLYYPKGVVVLPKEFHEELENLHLHKLVKQFDETEDVFYILDNYIVAILILMMDNDYGIGKDGYMLELLVQGIELGVLENIVYTIMGTIQHYLTQINIAKMYV